MRHCFVSLFAPGTEPSSFFSWLLQENYLEIKPDPEAKVGVHPARMLFLQKMISEDLGRRKEKRGSEGHELERSLVSSFVGC